MISRIDLVLPSGGRISGPFAERAGATVKALISLGGETCLERSIREFRATERVNRIVVVGPPEVLELAGRIGVEGLVEEGDTGPENIFRGLTWLKHQDGDLPERALIAATDLPFITAEAIGRFLSACLDDLDLCVPVMSQRSYVDRFPGTQNVFVPLVGGGIGIGCVFRVNAQLLLERRNMLDRIFSSRKNQWRLARIAGLQVTLGWLFRRLTLPAIERRLRKLFRCRGAAITDSPPELAFDIDLPSEYEYARRCFSEDSSSAKLKHD